MTNSEEKETTFLGRRIETIVLRGLTTGLQTRIRNGRPVQVLTLSDTEGIKWELHYPQIFRHDPNRIALYHRNASGKGFHLQRHAAGTGGGLQQLFQCVAKNEQKERVMRKTQEPHPPADYVQPAKVANGPEYRKRKAIKHKAKQTNKPAMASNLEATSIARKTRKYRVNRAYKPIKNGVRTSRSILSVKTRTGGRNRPERRGP